MCIILYFNVNGKIVLAKNRDRIYNPELEIHHDFRNGVEILYYRDRTTNWAEGINEYGICLVNSALYIKQDEYDGLNNFQTNIRQLIWECLEQKNIDGVVNILQKNKIAIYGLTIVTDGKRTVLFEAPDPSTEPIITDITNKKKLVLTNHGYSFPDGGYKKGRKKIGSMVRQFIISKELNKITSDEEILPAMRKNYKDLDPRFSPYRDRKATLKYLDKENVKDLKVFKTSSQILFSPSDLKMEFAIVKDVAKFVGVFENLPLNYPKKLSYNIYYVTKDTEESTLPFDCEFIKNLKHILGKYSPSKKLNLIFNSIIRN